VIADDHPLYRRALRQALEGLSFPTRAQPDTRVEVTETGDLEASLQLLGKRPDIDLILLDLAMPGTIGFSGLLRMSARFPAIPIMIVSALEDAATIRRSLHLGASGFIPKSANIDRIREAISAVLGGETWKPSNIELGIEVDSEIAELADRIRTLTRTQVRVLYLLSEGLTNRQIAIECDITESTVKGHVTAILKKLKAHSRTHVVVSMSKFGTETILSNNTL
jgi:DNA-binding NarL/FixJ family response regulator